MFESHSCQINFNDINLGKITYGLPHQWRLNRFTVKSDFRIKYESNHLQHLKIDEFHSVRCVKCKKSWMYYSNWMQRGQSMSPRKAMNNLNTFVSFVSTFQFTHWNSELTVNIFNFISEPKKKIDCSRSDTSLLSIITGKIRMNSIELVTRCMTIIFSCTKLTEIFVSFNKYVNNAS